MYTRIIAFIALTSVASVLSANAFAHGASAVAGEWLPVIDKEITNDTSILSQVQSSPLGNEILVQFTGEGTLYSYHQGWRIC